MESDRNVVRVIFFLRNNFNNTSAENTDDSSNVDIKALQERLGRKLGVKYSVITFLNENLGEKLGVIEEECQKLQCKLGCKLGESWEKHVFHYCFFCIIPHGLKVLN